MRKEQTKRSTECHPTDSSILVPIGYNRGMAANPAPVRRRFQFSLRTLLIAVGLLSVACAIVGPKLVWISQRQGMIRPAGAVGFVPNREPRSAPGGLWLFGEQGMKSLHVINAPQDQVDEMKRLFPEAEIDSILIVNPGGL